MMQRISDVKNLREIIHQWRFENRKIAFVPTMGNLHAGHIKLVEEAEKIADKVVVSIFVNPLQFGEGEDFHSYPRTMDEDCEKLVQANVDCVFCPDVDVIYGKDITQQTKLIVPSLTGVLCGVSRPGHFDGVSTVVAKLFNIVQADYALFGKKDYQQLLIIRKLVQDLNIPIQIVGIPTVREADGLAMSSRNQYLNETQRQLAPRLYQMLQDVAGQLKERDADIHALEEMATSLLNSDGIKVDYFKILTQETLLEPDEKTTEYSIFVAAYIGKARLIDNLQVSKNIL